MKLKQNKLEHISSVLKIKTKSKDMPHGQFEAILTVEQLDRHGEIVAVKGVKVNKDQVYKMYYNHQTTGDALPIGKWIKIWKKDGVLMGRGEVDLEDDFAIKVYKKLLGGFIDSVSIGFYPQEYDSDSSTWTKSMLVEASLVAEPANVGAKVTQKDLGFTEEEFKKSLKVKLKEAKEDTEDNKLEEKPEKKPEDKKPLEPPSAPPDVVVSADSITEIKDAVDELKSKQGALEEAFKAANENPAMKTLIRVRVASKQVDQANEELTRVLKVKLKGDNNV
jgi:HK97 family phage prohead protease